MVAVVEYSDSVAVLSVLGCTPLVEIPIEFVVSTEPVWVMVQTADAVADAVVVFAVAFVVGSAGLLISGDSKDFQSMQSYYRKKIIGNITLFVLLRHLGPTVLVICDILIRCKDTHYACSLRLYNYWQIILCASTLLYQVL